MPEPAAYTPISPAADRPTIELDGSHLTIESLVAISRAGAHVRIAPGAVDRVARGHRLLLEAARRGMPIYGFNRGPGDQQSVTTFTGDPTSPENRALLADRSLRRFRLGATSGSGPEVSSEDTVRATMAARLNTMLNGRSGTSTGPLEMLAAMLNRRVAPVLRSGGSVGQSDFPVLANLAATMVGAGHAHLEGVRMPAVEALQKAGIDRLAPRDRDYGSLIASNAYTAGRAGLLVADVHRLIDWTDLIYSISLQAQNGNISPLLEPAQRARPYPHQTACARRILDLLSGSYLLEASTDRRLQDPLSFRDVSQVHGAARRAADLAHGDIAIQLNSSDDNPTIAVDEPGYPLDDMPQAAAYRVESAGIGGVVMPSANYDPTVWAQTVELLSIALVALAAASAQRTAHLGATASRLLDGQDALEEVQGDPYAVLSIMAEIESLARPTLRYTTALASGIEDLATHAPGAVGHAAEIVDNIYGLLAHELLTAVLCIDRRRDADPSLALGSVAEAAIVWLRRSVPRRSLQAPRSPPAEALSSLLRRTAPEQATQPG